MLSLQVRSMYIRTSIIRISIIRTLAYPSAISNFKIPKDFGFLQN